MADRRAALVWWIGPASVAVVLAPLLIGFRPVGGDPDRLFRPIKGELARALREGRLPFWSDRLGLGFPVLAESHAAALYPPNWVLYRWLDVDRAYDLAMWGHHVALAVAVALYARRLEIGAAGAALASCAFALSGFLSIHSSHEWAYHGLLYAVLALLAADGFACTGRLGWLAFLAVASGLGWVVGHFQMQAWALPVVAVASLARLLRLPAWVAVRRGLILLLGLGWGVALAAAQLGPSWELARTTGSENRDRLFYSYPPAHVLELAWPAMYRAIDPEDAYWFREQTTGYEACLFVGTPAIVLSWIGAAGWRRPMRVWVGLTLATFSLATMPRLWPEGYQAVTTLPGIGLFRCPARWTAFTSLGLALLAGAGFDRNIGSGRFALGISSAVGFACWGLARGLPAEAMLPGAGVWLAVVVLLIASRRWSGLAWVVVGLAAVELGWYYYHATTVWGRQEPLPDASPVFARLAEEEAVGRVAGPLDDLPLRGGWGTAELYVGFTLDPMNRALRELSSRPEALQDPAIASWLVRRGVTHAIVEGDAAAVPAGGVLLYDGTDPALDRRARSPRSGKLWRLFRLGPQAEAATVVRVAGLVLNDAEAISRSIRGLTGPGAVTGTVDQVSDLVPRLGLPARVLTWDDRGGRVEHAGPCLVVVNRIDYPGWQYRVDGRGWLVPRRVAGGLQALVIEGTGVSRIELKYEPTDWIWAQRLSLIAGSLLGFVLIVAARRV